MNSGVLVAAEEASAVDVCQVINIASVPDVCCDVPHKVFHPESVLGTIFNGFEI